VLSVDQYDRKQSVEILATVKSIGFKPHMDPWMPSQLASIGLSIIVQGRNLFGERDESVHFAIVFLILTKFNFVHSGDESSIIQYGRKSDDSDLIR
jgi:hypothetical protein